MNNKNVLRYIYGCLSVISTIGIIAWIITDFFGGMIIYMFMYWWIVIPLSFLYLMTLFITIVKVIEGGFKKNKLTSITHALGMVVIFSFILYHSELFKSKKELDSSLIDDLSRIDLILRENGRFETNSSSLFGTTVSIRGKYLIKNDTIIFLDKPYTNDFIPDTVVIDRDKNAIFFNKKENGEFSRTKSFVNYFEINSYDCK